MAVCFTDHFGLIGEVVFKVGSKVRGLDNPILLEWNFMEEYLE